MSSEIVDILSARVREACCHSELIRYSYSFGYRQLFRQDRGIFLDYCQSLANKHLIAVNLCHLCLAEHIRNLFPLLETHPKLAPLFFAPTPWPANQRKEELYRYLARRYELVLGKNLFVYPWLALQKFSIFLDMLISPHGRLVSLYNIIYAHGLAGLGFTKNLQYVRLLDRYNILCLTGPLQRKTLIAAQKLHGGKLPEMIEVGYLRGDRLIEQQAGYDRSILFNKLGLENIPTIIYAPTWGTFASGKEWFDDVVQVCTGMGVNLLLRLHPILTTGGNNWDTGGVNWQQKLADARSYDRIRVVLDHDIDEYLLASDLLITDTSGMGLEFMVLEKPVIFLSSDHYFKLFGDQRPEMWVRKGMEVRSAEDLKNTLRKVLKNPVVDYPIAEIAYNRGKSTSVMMNLLEQLAEQSG